MTSSTTPAAARKYFDQAMSLLDTDMASAAGRFREATEIDPSMADAWLGRIAAGDESLSTVQHLYEYGTRLHRETNRLGAHLSAPIKAGPYLSISVTEASHAGLAPALIVTANKDPLRDHGTRYAEALRSAGTEVDLRDYGPGIHGFLSLPGVVPVARQALADIVAFLGERL